MNIDHLRHTLSDSGLDVRAIDELVTLASALPPSNISAAVSGLTETETATLLSYLLRTISPDVGVEFGHVDVLGTLRFPIVEPRAISASAASDRVEHESYYDSAN